MILSGTYSFREGDLTVHNAHFSWVPGENRRNIEEALPFLEASLSRMSLLTGDFNASPGDEGPLLLLEQGWIDGWQLLHPEEPGFTFESGKADRRIDYAMVSPGLAPRLRGIDLIKAPEDGHLSDHLGLLVTVDITQDSGTPF